MIAGFIVDTVDLFAVAWPRLLLFAMSLSLAVIAAHIGTRAALTIWPSTKSSSAAPSITLIGGNKP